MPARFSRTPRPELQRDLLHALVLFDVDGLPTTGDQLAQAYGLHQRYGKHWRIIAGDALRVLERQGLIERRTVSGEGAGSQGRGGQGGGNQGPIAGWMPRHPEAEQALARIAAVRARLQERGFRTVEQRTPDSSRRAEA